MVLAGMAEVSAGTVIFLAGTNFKNISNHF